mmetsp:Transcript_19829/g.29193  ORF Transcript_19829/g.29193 Transcript_19829/m.29193 type:complete len:93 (-) Transcript_19829:334-612(-)
MLARYSFQMSTKSCSLKCSISILRSSSILPTPSRPSALDCVSLDLDFSVSCVATDFGPVGTGLLSVGDSATDRRVDDFASMKSDDFLACRAW